MTKKVKMALGVVALVAVVAVAVIAVNPSMGKGMLVKLPGGQVSEKLITCSGTWTKVFEAEKRDTNSNGLVTTMAASSMQLQNLVKQGCSFRVAEQVAAGGGSGVNAYDCTIVSANSMDFGEFGCFAGQYNDPDNDTGRNYKGVRMYGFDKGGNFGFAGSLPTEGTRTFSVFIKK